ncbi:hypothetical protein BS50DRAFT_522144 [Corynespora cassiicola Philippines]|uniref:Rhodopsin domain-containing protein n=1 Tax=Corynespora cassiicola Philippines TaxID=1448308 RepID=A0A2T2NVQ9_CORCC|nr:hypothetical protein BS50DRAFT_522144 [Corynespora cassiicola Philippines]
MSTTPVAIDLEGPAGRTPPGVVPHLINSSEDQKWYYVGVVTCLVIAGIFVVLRFYTKLRIIRRTDLSDWSVTLAYILLCVFVAIGYQYKKSGGGVHQWNVQLKNMIKILYWLNADEALYGVIVFLIKFTILHQYLRIFAPVRQINPVMFFGASSLILLNGIFYTIATFLTIFACSPREKIWDPFIVGGHCMDYNALITTAAAFNIWSDTMILILPIRSIWKLRIPIRKKICIVLLLGLGLVTCVASAIMLVFVFRLNNKEDITYNTLWLGLTCCAEMTLGIIVSCIITLPKLGEARSKNFRIVLSKVFKPSIKSETRTATEAVGNNTPNLFLPNISQSQACVISFLAERNDAYSASMAPKEDSSEDRREGAVMV